MLKPGTILDDRYEIIDVVGTGGMSTVYRAKDERLKRFVAIKVLKSDYSSDANFVSKFRAEAQSSAGLTHPNIVSVYDVCEDDGRYFIVMELVEGITLKEYINLNGRLSMDQALNFSIQIASGLEAAHEHHVIHRDIKPQNIIVSKSGTIKVTDFGIAKAATSTTMSTTGIGSVHYISPEQARGGYSDERSDIYSLGITMYEMVTGRVPFEGDTNVAIALMHIQNDLIPPRELYPDIYQSFEKIILKATQKKPERRYLTAAALIADLKRVKDNPSIDIIVAPAQSVSNAPTQQFSTEDMRKIKNESSQKRDVDELDAAIAAAGRSQMTSSDIVPDTGRIEELLNQNDDELEEIYEEEAPAPRKKGSVKKYRDDFDEEDDEEDVYAAPSEYDDDPDGGVDPKLEKAVMIGGIAAAVIIAAIIFALVGSVMGWFKFGSKKDKDTTETETSTVTTETATEDTTEASTEEEIIKMLDVEGYTLEKALKNLEDAGFTNVKTEEVFDAEVIEGYIVEQSVEARKEIHASDEIILKVSKGPEDFEVPDVVGKSVSEADELIKEHFNPTHSYENSDTVEKDHIISQSVNGGEKLAGGSVITLVVSNGKEIKQAVVPNLYNMSEASAKQALTDAKLSVGSVTTEFNSEVAAGSVIRQSIAANTETTEGTVVDFVVSAGVKAVTYTGNVSGSIICDDEGFLESLDSVTVTVYIQDASGSHEVFSTNVGKDLAGTINVSGKATGLSYNDGSVTYTVKDGAGNDISGRYTKNVTVTYNNE
ncbi:MAG: Stk1 family PASTA domain-containing Ser/Thr kinase [Eubacterium sp.]|nr:Stk1 family PASTA domain-containing Ser/Thr kinase [Eubacterium sp.]